MGQSRKTKLFISSNGVFTELDQELDPTSAKLERELEQTFLGSGSAPLADTENPNAHIIRCPRVAEQAHSCNSGCGSGSSNFSALTPLPKIPALAAT